MLKQRVDVEEERTSKRPDHLVCTCGRDHYEYGKASKSCLQVRNKDERLLGADTIEVTIGEMQGRPEHITMPPPSRSRTASAFDPCLVPYSALCLPPLLVLPVVAELQRGWSEDPAG